MAERRQSGGAHEVPAPNAGRRSIRLVVIPSLMGRSIKVVTVMWVDGT